MTGTIASPLTVDYQWLAQKNKNLDSPPMQTRAITNTRPQSYQFVESYWVVGTISDAMYVTWNEVGQTSRSTGSIPITITCKILT